MQNDEKHSTKERTSGFNETGISLFLGILGLFTPIVGIIFSILGIIYGVHAYRIKSPKKLKGKGWSIAGIVIGCVGVVRSISVSFWTVIDLIK